MSRIFRRSGRHATAVAAVAVLALAAAGCAPSTIDLPAEFQVAESGEELLDRIATATDRAGTYEYHLTWTADRWSYQRMDGEVRLTDTWPDIHHTYSRGSDLYSRRESTLVRFEDVSYVAGFDPELFGFADVPASPARPEEWVRIDVTDPDTPRDVCRALGDFEWLAYPESVLEPLPVITKLRPIRLVEQDGQQLVEYWGKLDPDEAAEYLDFTWWLTLDLADGGPLQLKITVDRYDQVHNVQVIGGVVGDYWVDVEVSYGGWGEPATITPPSDAQDWAESGWADYDWVLNDEYW